MKQPNLFIVGAPRSGTTSMHAYLDAHPQIFMSRPKEPLYWSSETQKNSAAGTLDEYLSMFRNAGDEHRVVGEASVLYLYSADAPERIRKFNPAAKILIFVRNPIELVASLHQQSCLTFDEEIRDFAEAWRLRNERANGRFIPANCRIPMRLDYVRIGRLNAAISRWHEHFPAEQIKLVLFDELQASPREAYESVLRFLDLESDGQTRFPTYNAAGVHRSVLLAYLLFRLPPVAHRFIEYAKSAFSIRTIGTREYAVRPQPRAEIDPALRREMAEEFRSDVAELAVRLPVIRELWGDFQETLAEAPTSQKVGMAR